MDKTDFKKILREHGFPLSMRDFGRIVCLTPSRLRGIYRQDSDRFFRLLSVAVERWDSICRNVREK